MTKQSKWNPKKYFSKEQTLIWGKDLTPNQMRALRRGEVFILLGKDGEPHSRVLMDSYDQIREKGIIRNSRACSLPKRNINSVGDNRAETCIPGTTIPKKFYVTIALDMEELFKAGIFKWREIVEDHFKGIIIGALEQLKDYRLRHRVFKFYGVDPGAGFKMDLHFHWVDIDGIIQLLRMDMLSIGMKSINAEIDHLDGKLEEVDGVLKPVKE